jgi:methylated-DNA-[protein]-cysteine S-methyltransferase
MTSHDEDRVAVFPSALGWMAIVGGSPAAKRFRLKQLTFGHASPGAALTGLNLAVEEVPPVEDWNPRLVRRLQAYADGRRDDFADVPLDESGQTAFQREVVRHCRRVEYGRTLTYGALAVLAGCPRAARAVGNVMRINATPLVVPCHRVVAAGAGLGGYSAGEGVRMKLRLLELEGARQAPQFSA